MRLFKNKMEIILIFFSGNFAMAEKELMKKIFARVREENLRNKNFRFRSNLWRNRHN